MTNVRSITPLPPADFTPELGNYKTLQPFRYWCQKVLPLVYDDSLSYYELLCKVVDYLNKTMEDVGTLNGDVVGLHTAYEELQNYVNEYFSTLDVQVEINNKLDQMAENGVLQDIVNIIFYSLEKQTTYVNLPDLSNKRFVCVGDSYCGGYTPETGSVVNNGWAKQMQNTLQISDENFYISHNGGTGFANKGDSENWGETIATIPVLNPQSIDYVIFCGGYNDAAKTTVEVTTGIVKAILETKKRFTKAKILIGFVGMSGENYNAFQALKRTFLAYSTNSVSGSYLYMSGVENSLYSLKLLSETDKHHPTKDGNAIIARSIINYLCSGNCPVIYSGSTTISPLVTMPNTNGQTQYKNGKCCLFVDGQTITINSGNVTFNKYGINLFTTELTALFNNPPNDNYTISCVLVVEISSKTRYINATAQIYRSDMNTYNLLITLINDEKTNYLSVDNLKQIQLPSLKLQGEMFTTFQ